MNRKSSKRNTSSSQSTTAPSEVISISQREELPGVDYKNKLGPRSLRHNRLDLNTLEGESRFLNSVTKELSKKENTQKLQTAFTQQERLSPTSALAVKEVWCTNQNIGITVSSPLKDISTPSYIQKWKNSELIKELPVRNTEEDLDGVVSVTDHARPAVIAVNLKWKNGIQVRQCHKFTTRTRQLEPILRTTEFDYETKTKFSKDVEAACEELFPDWRARLMILDGNDSHGLSSTGGVADSGKNAKTAKSDKLEQDSAPSDPYTEASGGDPFTREWKEFTDQEEHRILVIPQYSKNGFDMDLSKHYQFPYQAKFVIGRRAYHHKFILRVPLAKTPQHFGLIFTFSEDPNGRSKLRIKSLLTVYSIYPNSPKYSTLETYQLDNLEGSPETSPKTKPKSTQSVRAAKNAVELLSTNLKEEKLTAQCMNSYIVARDLPQAAHGETRFRRLYDRNLCCGTAAGQKQKTKQQLQRKIKMEQARC